MRDFVLRTVSQFYAGKQETESKFDRILAELQRDREEQAKKWDEFNKKWEEYLKKSEENDKKWEEYIKKSEENDKKWEENNKKWDEFNKKWEEYLKKSEENDKKWYEQHEINKKLFLEIQKLSSKIDTRLGAMGARWGLQSEASFRNALKSLLEETFQVEVINFLEYDKQGEVFGNPDQIEIDIIIQNGVIIACEIKSSMSKSDMYTFEKKVQFYEKQENKKVNRKIVISPMVDQKAQSTAEKLGIEVFSFVEDITNLS